jgi:hypothetical protein
MQFAVHVHGVIILLFCLVSDLLLSVDQVEEIDLFPTLVEAATMGVTGGETTVPACPASTQASRATALCTEVSGAHCLEYTSV